LSSVQLSKWHNRFCFSVFAFVFLVVERSTRRMAFLVWFFVIKGLLALAFSFSL